MVKENYLPTVKTKIIILPLLMDPIKDNWF